MVNYCCVTNCANNSRDNQNISFFSIPLDEIRQLQWLERIGRIDLMQEPLQIVHKKRVCSKHFENSMFAGFSFSKNKLKNDAIPTLFDEGVGFKGINVGASTSSATQIKKRKRSSSELIENIPPLLEFEPNSSKSGESQLQNVPDQIIRRLRTDMQNLKRKCLRLSKSPEPKSPKPITKEQFIEFCKQTFSESLTNFIQIQLELFFKQFALIVFFWVQKFIDSCRKPFSSHIKVPCVE